MLRNKRETVASSRRLKGDPLPKANHPSIHRMSRVAAVGSSSEYSSLEKMTEWTKAMMKEHPEFFVNDCVSSNYPRVIHNWRTWKFLQDVYNDEAAKLGRKNSGVSSWETEQTGLSVPYYIRDDGPRGRSVYTAISVDEGTKVWSSSKLAKFYHPQELISFLRRLPHDLQCDALLWAYPAKGSETVELALDEGSYVNHGETEALLNLDSNCYALRDIQAGEELLEDYSHFIDVSNLEWFNIIRSVAWEENNTTTTTAQNTSEDAAGDIHQAYVRMGVPATTMKKHRKPVASVSTVQQSIDHAGLTEILGVEPTTTLAESSSNKYTMLAILSILVLLLFRRRFTLGMRRRTKDNK